MKIIYYSIILSNICQILAKTKLSSHYIQYCDWLDVLSPKILDRLYTHQQAIIFLFNMPRLSVQYNVIIESLSKKYPLMIVTEPQIDKVRSLISEKTFSTYIILSQITTRMEERFKTFIKRMNFSLIKVLPQCLVINFNYNGHPKKLQDFMDNAWQAKFLDFTFIHVNLKKNCSIPTTHYFNPFIEKMNQNVLSQNTELFPNKLIDTNGYKIHARDCNTVIKDKFGNLNSLSVMNMNTLPLLSIGLKKLNVSLSFEKKEIPLETNINMITLLPYQIAINQEVSPQIRNLEQCTKIKAVVPIVSTDKINLPYEVLIHMGAFVMTGTLGACIRKILHDNSEYWGTLNIVIQLLGSSAQIDPKTLVERILTLYFGFMGIYYSGEVFSSIVGTLLLQGTLPFDTFQEIYESGFTINVGHTRYLNNHKQHINDPYYNYIVRSWKYMSLDNLPKCLDEIYSGRKVICVADMMRIDNFFSHNPQYLSVMKIASPTFGCLRLAFMMDFRAVVSDKLQMIVDRITETGIDVYHQRIRAFRNLRSIDLDDKVVNRDIIPILFVGYAVASLILLTEIISGCINQMRNLFVFL